MDPTGNGNLDPCANDNFSNDLPLQAGTKIHPIPSCACLEIWGVASNRSLLMMAEIWLTTWDV